MDKHWEYRAFIVDHPSHCEHPYDDTYELVAVFQWNGAIYQYWKHEKTGPHMDRKEMAVGEDPLTIDCIECKAKIGEECKR
jgi:hypothetical protein